MSVTYSGRVGEESERQIWKRLGKDEKKLAKKRKKPTAKHHSNLVCSICHKRIRKTDPTKYPFKDRMARLRRHRKKYHPKAFKKSVRKAVRTKRKHEIEGGI